MDKPVKKKRDLFDESRKPMTNIMLLAWPIFLENILTSLMNYADTAMVGSMGAYATASVSISNSVMFLLNGVVMALGVGITALIARSVGAKDAAMTKKLAAHTMLVLLYIGLPLSIVFGCLYRAIPLWMGAEPDVLYHASRYNLIVAFGRPFQVASMVIFAATRGCGDTKNPLRINVIANIINVVFNFIMIYPTRELTVLGVTFTMFGCGWGVDGAAAATAISMAFSGLAALGMIFFKKDFVISLSIHDSYKLDWGLMKQIVRISIPAMLERICMSVANIVVSSSIASLGTIVVAANTVYITTESIAFMPGFAFASAATTFVGQALGAGKPDQAERYLKSCVVLSVIVMIFAGAGLFFFGKYVAALFTIDNEVIAIANRCLQIVAFLEPAQTGAAVIAGGLRGAGDTMWTMLITAAGTWILRAGVGAILCIRILHLGLPEAVFCMLVESYIRFFMFYLRYRTGKWKYVLKTRPGEVKPA